MLFRSMTSTFSFFATTDMAKKENVLVMWCKKGIAGRVPAKFAGKAGKCLLAAAGLTRIDIPGITIIQRFFVLNLLQDFEKVFWRVIGHLFIIMRQGVCALTRILRRRPSEAGRQGGADGGELASAAPEFRGLLVRDGFVFRQWWRRLRRL